MSMEQMIPVLRAVMVAIWSDVLRMLGWEQAEPNSPGGLSCKVLFVDIFLSASLGAGRGAVLGLFMYWVCS